MIGDEARRRRRTPCARVSSSVAPHTPVAPVSTQLSNYRHGFRPTFMDVNGRWSRLQRRFRAQPILFRDEAVSASSKRGATSFAVLPPCYSSRPIGVSSNRGRRRIASARFAPSHLLPSWSLPRRESALGAACRSA